jgi:adenylate kinase
LLNQEISKQTAAGIQAELYVKNGELVPDQLMTNLVFKALKESEVLENGYILQGYPRTKQQANELLQAGILPDYILDIDLPDHKIIENATNNRVDSPTNATTKSLFYYDSSIQIEHPQKTDLEIVKKKLFRYRKDQKTFIHKFKSGYRRFNLSQGFAGSEQKLLSDIQEFLGLSIVTKSPRSFRIIVAGFPGSGKSTIADCIGRKYSAVVVSPKSVILQAISAGNGHDFIPYLSSPHLGN